MLPEYVTLEGTRYATEKLSDVAKQHVLNLQVVEQEIHRLNNLLAIAKTARNAYEGSLKVAIKHGVEVQTKPSRGAKKNVAELGGIILTPETSGLVKKTRARKKAVE